MAVRRIEQVEVQYGEPISLREKHRPMARLDVVPMANAVGIVTIATYLACVVIALTSMEFLVSVAQIWFHGMAWTSSPLVFSLVPFVLGGVSFTATMWILTAATASLYNVLPRR